VFGQVYLADQGRSLSPRIGIFRDRYFDSTGYGGYTYMLKPDGMKKIHKAIAPVVYRVESEQYLDLPEFIPDDIWVDLPPEARRVYKDLERDLFSRFENGEKVVAVNNAVMTGKCEQVANGGLWLMPTETDPRKAKILHTAKVEALMDLCDELNGKQMAIAYHYEHDLKNILDAFGKNKPPHIGGGVPWKRAVEIQDEWNAGNIEFLLGQPQSMGHGLNLQKCNPEHVCWFHTPWSFDDWDQFNKRFRRQGNKSKHLWLHNLFARDTIDVVKRANIEERGLTQKGLMDAMGAYRRSRKR
jgi:hypothetical protein